MSSSSPYPPPDSLVKEAVVSGMAAYRKLVAEDTSTLENPVILEQLAKRTEFPPGPPTGRPTSTEETHGH